jgi:hypothetical protein
MVKLLPILFPGPKSHLEKQNSQLFTLQQTASARGTSGISRLSKAFCGEAEWTHSGGIAPVNFLNGLF